MRIENALRTAFTNLSGMLVIRDYAIPLVQQLKNAGFGVYYLSNYSRKAYDECGESLAFMPYMDGGIVSFKVGITKPDPQVYRCFLDRYGMEAESCDFTRQDVGKLSFEDTIRVILSMGKGTVSDELIDFFQMDAECIPTQSALIQRRNQLSEYAFQYLFHESSARFNPAEKREEKDPDLVVESQESS